jgi:broad specificity phosphatase PhoE
MRIYFVRHGESQANLLGVISNRGLQHGLTGKGCQQAEVLARRLEGIPIQQIYSSPLLRAVETSQILAGELKLEYEISDALREFDCGIMEGHSDEAAWQAWRELTQAWVEHDQWERRIAGGESFNDLRERFEPFLQGLIDTYRETGENLVCVGHGGLYGMLLPLVIPGLNAGELWRKGMAHTDCIVAEWGAEGSGRGLVAG